jgi:hypothetical protein
MSDFGNLLFRGYTMLSFDKERFAEEAVWWAKQLGLFAVDEVRKAVEFISLSKSAQNNVGLWSGGKRPILIPALHGLMLDLAAIVPFFLTLFFGLKKVQQVGGDSFENSVRNAVRLRGFDICLQGKLRWPSGELREVDAAVRIGDRLLLLEFFFLRTADRL